MVQRSIKPSRQVRRGQIVSVLAGVIALFGASASARAQPAKDSGDAAAEKTATSEIDEAVAAALFDRGQLLFAKGDFHNAKKLFIEALERSPQGTWADKSMAMLRSANERLGIRDLEHGAPRVEKIPTDDEPVDPYGEASVGDAGGDGPVNPYKTTESGGGDRVADSGSPLDPYGDTGGASAGGGRSQVRPGGRADTGAPSASTMRARVLVSGAAWGAYNGALLGDLVTGVGTSTDGEIAGFFIGGALVGTGASYLYWRKSPPTEDELALVNSMGLYGAAAGLLLGVGFDPIESEAYSLQGMLGSAIGLGAGFYLTRKLDISRRRSWRLDLGAAAGVAVTWGLFYPLVSDDSTNNDEQAAGFISVAAMGGGALIAYLLTRGMDRGRHAGDGEKPPAPPVAGLITRSGKGAWGLGHVAVRPIVSPALTGSRRSAGWGLDVLGGRF